MPTMPIMLEGGGTWSKSVPFSLLNEEWAQRNHQQSLQKLADRGGISPEEAIAIMDKRRYKPMPDDAVLIILKRRLDQLR